MLIGARLGGLRATLSLLRDLPFTCLFRCAGLGDRLRVLVLSGGTVLAGLLSAAFELLIGPGPLALRGLLQRHRPAQRIGPLGERRSALGAAVAQQLPGHTVKQTEAALVGQPRWSLAGQPGHQLLLDQL